jgi:hypothetical protein
MTLGGWLVMLVSIGSVTTLFLWCMAKVATVKDTEHLHASGEHTPDEQT